MTRDEWIVEFASKLGVTPPDAQATDTLLSLAGVAAHHSERTSAPVACYLVGLAGIDPSRAAEIAETIGES